MSWLSRNSAAPDADEALFCICCPPCTMCLRLCLRRFYAALVLAELMRSEEEPRQVAAAFKLPQGQVEAMQDKAGVGLWGRAAVQCDMFICLCVCCRQGQVEAMQDGAGAGLWWRAAMTLCSDKHHTLSPSRLCHRAFTGRFLCLAAHFSQAILRTPLLHSVSATPGMTWRR